MHHIRASTSKPGRAHIYSFRRQAYIKEEDERLLPETLKFNHENTTHWIYLSTESTHCFICKQKGHIAKVCPECTDQTSTHTQTSQLNSYISSDSVILNTQDMPSISKNCESENLRSSTPILKRPPPPSTTSEDSISTIQENQNENFNIKKPKDKAPNKPVIRKKKSQEQEDHSQQDSDSENTWIAAKKIIEENQDFVLDFNSFKSFIEKSYGQRNVKEIAGEFTSNIEGLSKMIGIIHPHIEDKKLKARCIRLKKS